MEPHIVDSLRKLGIRSEIVLSAINTVPRQVFYDTERLYEEHQETELPMDMGETIAHIFLIAKKLDSIVGNNVDEIPKKVLEIGTGRGYQTAVLAEIVDHVYSIERDNVRLEETQKRFLEWEVEKVSLRHDDGLKGWAGFAPYDAIIVDGYVEEIPEVFKTQLAENGKLVIPVGNEMHQALYVITKHGEHFKKTLISESVQEPPLKRGIIES